MLTKGTQHSTYVISCAFCTMTISRILLGLGTMTFGIIVLYFTQRNPVHPFFRTWWAKHLDDPQTFDRIMGGVGGIAFTLMGLFILVVGL